MTISISRVVIEKSDEEKNLSYIAINFKKKVASEAGLEPNGIIGYAIHGKYLKLLYLGFGRVVPNSVRIHGNGTTISIPEVKFPALAGFDLPSSATPVGFATEKVDGGCWMVIDLDDCKAPERPKGFANLVGRANLQKMMGFAGLNAKQ